jgi:hypothetical protein
VIIVTCTKADATGASEGTVIDMFWIGLAGAQATNEMSTAVAPGYHDVMVIGVKDANDLIINRLMNAELSVQPVVQDTPPPPEG